MVITTRTPRVSNIYRAPCLIFVRRDGALSQMEAASEYSIEIPAGNHRRSGCGRLPRVRPVVWLDFGAMLDVAWLQAPSKPRSIKEVLFLRSGHGHHGTSSRCAAREACALRHGYGRRTAFLFLEPTKRGQANWASSATWQSMAGPRASPARPA